jgi:dihydrophenazinedicarboxylate synthase
VNTQVKTEQIRLPEFDEPPEDPVELLRQWLAAAKEHSVREPAAMALATTDGEGRSWSRMVSVVGIDAAGLLFTSHVGSHKGRHLAWMPWASGVLYWRETRQQVALAGPVEQLSDSESDDLWRSRPASTYPMSVASQQSSPLPDEERLRAEAQRLAASPEVGSLPRPSGWRGYRLVPDMVEFWLESPDRLHLRLRYDRTGSGWRTSRLQP